MTGVQFSYGVPVIILLSWAGDEQQRTVNPFSLEYVGLIPTLATKWPYVENGKQGRLKIYCLGLQVQVLLGLL